MRRRLTSSRSVVRALSCVAVLAASLAIDVPVAGAAAAPCGSLASSYNPAAPPVYDHVVVLMDENWGSADLVRSATTPFLTQLARQCGNETNFHAAIRPSQRNYMAATSGIASPVGATVASENIFSQLQGAGRTWASYLESMPAPCSGLSRNFYKPGHNPAFYYSNLRGPAGTCVRNDLPLDTALPKAIAADSLPAYSWITPNECHNFHWVAGCPDPSSARTKAGDTWLAGLVPQLTAMPSYRAGRTLIILTFDEGSGSGANGVDCTSPAYYRTSPGCNIPAVVLSPYIPPGTTDGTDLNLYSLLATTQDVLGVPRLGRAVSQASMRATMPF
jgi:hypothetical protein